MKFWKKRLSLVLAGAIVLGTLQPMALEVHAAEVTEESTEEIDELKEQAGDFLGLLKSNLEDVVEEVKEEITSELEETQEESGEDLEESSENLEEEEVLEESVEISEDQEVETEAEEIVEDEIVEETIEETISEEPAVFSMVEEENAEQEIMSVSEEGEYTHAIPKSEGVSNVIKRARELTDVKWTPLKDMPGVSSTGGVYTYYGFQAGKEYQGIPYSGVIDTDTYVGLNVSLDSFVTALQNENSVLYTKNLYADSYPKKAAYFGTVCSKFAQYALNIPGAYNTANVPNIEGLDTIALAGGFSVDDMELGDVIVDTSYHTAICTDILYDESGNIAYIEISEAVAPTARRLLWSVEEFENEFANYRLCRYQYIDETPYTKSDYVNDETGEITLFDNSLMPKYGDKYNYAVSESNGVINILKTDYDKAVVVRDNKVIDEIDISNTVETIEFSRSVPGNIEVYLQKDDGTKSESVHACVVQSSIMVVDSTKYHNGEISVEFSGTSGTPIYVQIGTVSDSVYYRLDENESTSANITFATSKVNANQVRVAYENEYGIYLSPWASFDVNENIGTGENHNSDPLLSKGLYWDGRTLTPDSSKAIAVEGKENYWTYTKIPVKANTKYYSVGANRMWFYDNNGVAISTLNVYKECTPPFLFETLDGAAYVGLSYAPELVEKGTETLTEVMPMGMKYDDHMDISNYETVEIIDAGTPTSYQVGYGVAEGTLDTAVVILEDDQLVATGIGTAVVKLDDTVYEITVEAAPISLLLLAGQSNMQGSEGNSNQSIICPEGQVYATYGDRYTMTVNNATNYAASALTGEYSSINVNGTTDGLSGYPIYSLNAKGAGKPGPDSGIAYEWARATGEKVWVVNAAHGGSSITTWQDGASNFEEAVALFSACQDTLKKEIAAGHYTLSHMGYFWCQGCSDSYQTAEWYVKKYLSMHDSLKTELSKDMDSDLLTPDNTLEFANMILVLAGSNGTGGYRYGTHSKEASTFFSSYEELEMRGQRVAQRWMANNPELKEINIVCDLGEDWVTLPDGSDGVEEYFAAHYENGKVDYTPQTVQTESWYAPKTPKDVKDSIHYNQIGYNEVGIEAARNTSYLLGYQETPKTETTVTFYNWTGYEEVSEVNASTVGRSSTLVVPVVEPCYRSKTVTYQVSEGLEYNYYDLITDTSQTKGTLTAVGANAAAVHVNAKELTSYRWELQNDILVSTGANENVIKRLSGSTENGFFIDTRYQMAEPITLNHDKEWILEWKMTGPWIDDASATSKKLFSEDGLSATVDARNICVNGTSNKIMFSYYNGTKHQHFGICLSPYGLHVADTHTYRLVNKVDSDGNMVYLFVDGKEIGPMNNYLTSIDENGTISDWVSGKDFSFGYLGTPSYLLDNGVIEYIEVSENETDENIHFHDYSEWETVSLPTTDTVGLERRTCVECGETQERNVEGVWQKYDFASHMSQLPEAVCCDTNLWTELEHDDEYFMGASGKWGTHSSGNVYSVTIPVNAGDQIYATSFGQGGSNGHASANGIRVTFFDAYGVVKTLTTAETYEEFSQNGYLTAPKGTLAVNVPMWNNSDSNELYILNLKHKHTVAVTKPTCEEQGYTTYICACGHSYVSDETSAKGHIEVVDKAVAATCETTGLTAGKHCSVCNKTLVKQEVVKAKGHTEVVDKAVAATCEATGLTVGKHCSVCNKVLAAQAVVPAKGHTEVVDKAVTATCETTGLTAGKHCSVCNKTLVKQEVVPAKGHTEVIDKAVAATCENTGLTAGKHCSVCSKVLVAHNVVKAKGHTEVVDKAVTATCETTGLTAGKHCSVCDKVLVAQTVVKAKGHTEVIDKAVAATCEKTGLTAGKHCSVCNKVLEAQTVVKAKGHTEVTDKAVAATCETTGLTAGKHCSVCNKILAKQEVVKALGHTEVTDKAVAATCETTGLTAGKHCFVCDKVLVAQTVVKAKGHTEVVDKAVAATCETTGLTAGKHCSVCNKTLVKQEVVPAKGHTEVIDKAVAATCENTGLTAGKHCSVCSKVLVAQTVVPAKGHTEVVDKAVAATCTETGLTEGKHCSVCNKVFVKQEVVKATGHNYEPVVTKPTCRRFGYTTYTCVCGDSYKDDYNFALNHRYTNYVSDGNASCHEDGTKTAKCDGCSKTDVIVEEGTATGHIYQNGKCYSCGMDECDPKEYILKVASVLRNECSSMKPRFIYDADAGVGYFCLTIAESSANVLRTGNEQAKEIWKGFSDILCRVSGRMTGCFIQLGYDVKCTFVVYSSESGSNSILVIQNGREKSNFIN